MAKTSMKIKATRPKFTVRKHNRCSICGRPRGFLRMFGVCRICFRTLASAAKLPGIKKSSW